MIKKSKINNLNAIEYIPKKFNQIIILSHGFLMDKEGPNGLFKELAERLYKLNYKVIRYDFTLNLHNFNKNAKFQNFALSNFLTDLDSIINYASKNNKEIILIGHSLGALVSMIKTSQSESKISKLILLSPPLSLKLPKLKTFAKLSKMLDLNVFKIIWKFFISGYSLSVISYFNKLRNKTLILYGTNDQFEKYSKINKVNSPYIIIKKIEGMDHFYKNHKPIIINEILKFLKTE